MPTAAEIAEAVWRYQMDDPRQAGTQSTTMKSAVWWVGADAGHTRNVADRLEAEINALDAPTLTDAQVQAIAAKVAAAPGLADAIAEKVAEKLAARLAQ
jgi:hypothetical protein